MDNGELDLSALDPAREPERWNAVVDRVHARVDAVIAGRVVRNGPLAAIEAWARPLLAAAALATILLVPLIRGGDDASRQVDAPAGSRERMLAAYTVEWVDSGRSPTSAELSATVEGRTPRPGGIQ